MSDEITPMAPGLMQAFAPVEESANDKPRRKSSADEPISALRSWTPKTRLGVEVMAGRIITYEAAIASGLPIREVEIVDALIPNLEDEIIKVNMVQAPIFCLLTLKTLTGGGIQRTQMSSG